MAKYTVTATLLPVLELDAKDNIASKKFYRRGDTVELSAEDAERHLRTGSVVEGKNELEDLSPGQAAQLVAHAASAGTGGGSDVTGGSGALHPDSAVDDDALEKANEDVDTKSSEDGLKERQAAVKKTASKSAAAKPADNA